jgi:uncharacterized protein (DUF2336 family)
MVWPARKKNQPGAEPSITYEEAKRLAVDADMSVRAHLAGREDIRPEILYFLAEDASPEVRCQIAANRRTPGQADLLLARDADEAVRRQLAHKIALLMPDLDAKQLRQAHQHVVEVLEVLAQDQAMRVRQILSDTLKDLVQAPPSVIQRLARDAEEVVACPVLEFSPLLSDEDLIEIISGDCAVGKLRAISRRHGVGEQVADAIVETDEQAAISELLANSSAQIREETLNGLVDVALDVTAWHEPLVKRPSLSMAAMQKLAGFVAASLLDLLQARKDLDKKTARVVAKEVDRRLKKGGDTEEKVESPEARAQRMHESGSLEDEALTRAMNSGDRDLVRHGLAVRAELPIGLVDHILAARSAKGVTALAWKAGCSMRFASQLQLRMGGIAPSQVLNARSGTDYPLTTDEMNWQIEFFQSLAG